MNMPVVVWITGLPGSGKSTVALALKEKFSDAVVLSVDALRKVVTPEPTYSDAEREYVYKALVYTAKTIYELGHNVIIDATGNRKFWRELARRLIPDFFEIYLKCPLELCVERERSRTETHGAPRNIYEKGRAGAPVPGIKIPYEEPEKPDLTINTNTVSPGEAAERIVQLIRSE